MKKTIFLVVLCVITVFCIVFGTARHMHGNFKLSNIPSIHFGDDDYEDDEYADDKHDASEKKGVISEVLADFSSIRIHSAVMEVKIEDGEQFKIEGNYTRDWLKPNYSVKNGQLEITQHKKKNGFTGGNNNCRIVITMPSNTKLSDVDIDSNVGDIRLRKFAADNIDIDVNVGEVSVRDVAFNKIEVNTNVGEVTVDPDDKLDDYDISLSADVGEVRVDGRGFKRSYNQRGKGNKKIKIDTNVGEINVK